MYRNRLREYFNFSKKELNGLLVLILLIAGVVFVPVFYRPEFFSPAIDIARFRAEAESFQRSARLERAYSYRDIAGGRSPSSPEGKLFHFDPNGLSESDWKKLGLSEKQIKVIKNYEAKGGRFHRKEDVRKMYVISPELYQRLEPFILIEKTENQSFSTSERPKAAARPLIAINQADSIELLQVKGIGPAFASRIIRYRDRLGGFYSLEQLKEVYGVDSVKFAGWLEQLQLDNTPLRLIDINQADFESLKRHPYLNYKQINAILQYRKQHGPYHSLQDLRKVAILNAEILRKIAPYLTFQ